MEKAFTKVEELAGTIKEYITTRIESAKLHTAEKSAVIIANIIAGAIVSLVFLLFIILASIALLGSWIGKLWTGFLIMAVFYLLAAIIVWKTRVTLIRLPVLNALIKQLFMADDEED